MKHGSISTLWLLAFSLVFSAACIADDGFKSEEDKVFYFLGMAMSGNLQSLNLTGDELALIERGMRDTLLSEPVQLDEAVYGQKLNELLQARVAASAEREASAAEQYIARMAAEDGAMTTNSGIVVVELVAGTGSSPRSDSTVTAHYIGTLRDGTVFDSSVERGQPFTQSLGSVIPCWREAIPLMKEGGKSRITCPSELAYGSRGASGIPGGSALTFEVELIDVVN